MKTPSETVQAAQPAFPHYFKPIPPGCTHLDVYRVLQLFEVADPALQHAVKKLLCAGARGAKDQAQDVAEAIVALQRWQQMRLEECKPDFFAQFATSDFQPAESVPVPEHPPHDPIAEGFRQKAERAESTFPGPDPAKTHAMAQWLLATESGKPIPSFDEWRAAYLARWANAPAEAKWLSQSPARNCFWHTEEPRLPPLAGDWTGGLIGFAGRDLLGRVACERRPTPAVDPERAAYLKRWEWAPEWATHATQDQGKECRWWRNQPSAYLTWVGKAATDTLEAYAPDDMLGSVRCEPRPRAEGER